MNVEASRAIRRAEVGAAKTMIEWTEERFNLKPTYLAADTVYGSAATLNWIVNDGKIAPHIPVIDKSTREDRTLSRADFSSDKEHNVYLCPNGKLLHTTGTFLKVLRFVIVPPHSIAMAVRSKYSVVPTLLHGNARRLVRIKMMLKNEPAPHRAHSPPLFDLLPCSPNR